MDGWMSFENNCKFFFYLILQKFTFFLVSIITIFLLSQNCIARAAILHGNNVHPLVTFWEYAHLLMRYFANTADNQTHEHKQKHYYLFALAAGEDKSAPLMQPQFNLLVNRKPCLSELHIFTNPSCHFPPIQFFFSSDLISSFSAVAAPQWFVAVEMMFGFLKKKKERKPLLIDLLAFVWCSKQCNIICSGSAVIQTPQPFTQLSSPKLFTCFYNWVCLPPLWLLWISLCYQTRQLLPNRIFLWGEKNVYSHKNYHATLAKITDSACLDTPVLIGAIASQKNIYQ